MNGLLEDGLGLMVLGMGFVFLFLIVLIYATECMSVLIRRFFPDVPERIQASSGKQPDSKQVEGPHSTIDSKVVAAISAAIHQHRNK